MAKIMIVDDNPDIVETLRSVVELKGHTIDVAYNGEELIRKVDLFGPDVILLDVMMPGYTLTETLQKLKEKRKIYKVILVTVVRFMKEEEEELKRDPNIVGYVTKPFEISQIIASVDNALN